jgi:hypothetical protein
MFGHINPSELDARDLAGIGRYVFDHPALPWARGSRWRSAEFDLDSMPSDLALDEITGLGTAAGFAIISEFCDEGPRTDLSALPMPAGFKRVFLDWTVGRVNFVEILDGKSS